jgi:flavin reductase (DIM6/NTAB) family NADH-FMN oxidoreductase RutF
MVVALISRRQNNSGIAQAEVVGEVKTVDYSNVKDKTFDELFVEIEPEELPENIFKLAGQDFTVITAGKPGMFNSMVASDGGFGLLMGKPVTFCGLRGSRYTLELILKDHVYTFSYFDERFKDQYMPFGQKSGRNTKKMEETTLTSVETPSGRMSYKEAKIIVECDLAQTHTVNIDEVYAEKNINFFKDAFEEVGSYHKIVFGDITRIWVRK